MHVFKLYRWYGGFNDCHSPSGTFNTFEELLEHHKQNRPNTPLYNYPDMGNDYYEEFELIIPETKECVWDPNKK